MSAPDARSTPGPIEDRLEDLTEELSGAVELVVCLDFDGTLAPIVDEPDEAAPTPATSAALEALVAEPAVTVAVVSGRALSDVSDRVGEPITYAGNHGLELSRASASDRAVHPIARRRATLIAELAATLEWVLAPIPNAHVEHKELTATVHLRRVPDSARDPVRRLTATLTDRIGGDAVERSTGKCVLELSPALDWGKGQAVDLIVADRPDDAYPVFVGDDVTDESGFRAVEPDGLGVLVGERPSNASARVDAPDDVATLLRWFGDEGVRALDRPASDARLP